MRGVQILHAPSPLGLKPPAEGRVPGVRFMPEALRRAGLHAGLKAKFVGEVTAPAYCPDIDPVTGVRNAREIESYSLELAARIGCLLESDRLTVVLGGDCSIMIGTALGLRRNGRYGLIYIDAHPDYLTPATSQTGGVAGMPLAIVTGVVPDLLAATGVLGPYIMPEDVIVVGTRDPLQVRGTSRKQVEGSVIPVHDLAAVRARGTAALADDLLRQMDVQGVDGVWVHVDADVLDTALMPAVDSPEPGGMTAGELSSLLAPLIASPLVKGLQVTIYDPQRDPDGTAAAVLTDLLLDAFRW